MKNIVTTGFLLTMIFVISSCSEDDKPTKEEAFISNLSGTWQIDAVELDGVDVTEEFENMVLVFNKDRTFVVQNSVGNIWPGSGTFNLQEGNNNLFDLLRDDGMVVHVNTLDDSILVFSMQFDSAPGRAKGLAGIFTFEMKR